MYSILEYLIKFSISLGALYVFYRLVLLPLTFYQWNRFYLLIYSLLSFVLPIINISSLLGGSNITDSQFVNKIPVIINYVPGTTPAGATITGYEWLMIVFIAGAIIMTGRLLFQYFSLLRIRKNARLVHQSHDLHLYETETATGPFSFGKSVYVNKEIHSPEELQRIIQHEIVHVKQQHTIDILVGEMLCIVNWFNPFAWLIRYAIRQNLEFIADNKVIDNGFDKKEYQYLLLKVAGIPQFNITNSFNLLNLKKRITMMNKMKSTKLHLSRFMFALPLLAFVMLSFRTEFNATVHTLTIPPIKLDTVPDNSKVVIRDVIIETVRVDKKEPVSKNYLLSIADDNGECVVLIKDKQKKILKAMTLTDWQKDQKDNEAKYGKIPSVSARNLTTAGQENGLTITSESGVYISTPLYVVDGVEQTAEFNAHSIAPTNIESMSVLKGMDATKKYGSKGEQGVIEITTKSIIKADR